EHSGGPKTGSQLRSCIGMRETGPSRSRKPTNEEIGVKGVCIPSN
ncbi:hypothetical protein TNCV_599611, partial [Trichonephila clavipes]